MKLKVTPKGRTLIPAFDEDFNNFKYFQMGEVYEFEFKKKRNIKFHRKYFGLLKLAYDNLPEHLTERYKNEEHFRKAVQIRAGICDVIISLDGEEIVNPVSIAFDKIDETEFEKVYNSVLNVIVENILIDTDPEVINQILSQF